jgi:6,7-dimethyl-8-ribityllumazine synthase
VKSKTSDAVRARRSNRGVGLRFAVVVSRFNDFVTDRLLTGALEALALAGVASTDISVIQVPGAWEIPFAAKQTAEQRRVAAVICLGCLIRGATEHFEYISSAASHGIMNASLATGVPMAFGVLTTNSVEEALERAVPGPANKGWEAATAALEMATLNIGMNAAVAPLEASRPRDRSSRAGRGAPARRTRGR